MTVFAAVLAAAGMTTMVANATRVAAVAEDAARLLGLRSPGARAADVTATKRRQAQLLSAAIPVPVGNGTLPPAVTGAGADSPLAALLEQPGFVGPAVVAGVDGPGGDSEVALADRLSPSPLVVVFPPKVETTPPPAGPIAPPPTPETNPEPPVSPPPIVLPTPILPGIPAVPEPSTWLLMLCGFAGIGTALRRSIRRSLPRGA